MKEPLVRLDGWGSQAAWQFSDPVGCLSALAPEQVVPVLHAAESATREGYYAVGFVAYEAAAALNPHLPSLPPREGLPLAWFALYRNRQATPATRSIPDRKICLPQLQPGLTPAQYATKINGIHQAIANGESYQINYTFPLTCSFEDDPADLYQSMLITQQPPFGAMLDNGRHLILSASPELFFHRQGDHVMTRPMKGTAPRGRFPAEDAALAEQLATSAKEQAENLMIVDLLRNDLGQIAETGSVEVERLFEQEQYPTVHQLTSTVSARLKEGIGLVDILRALFPCGSVTGAPKRRSMELITRLETQPRGLYCGAIGMLAPGNEAIFNVAIRTLLLDRQTGQISMGVGSGITWDAQAADEYAECLTKAAFLSRPTPPRLLESLRLEDGRYPLLQRHLARLAWSAGRQGHRLDAAAAEELLLQHAAATSGTRKVRLLLATDGQLEIASEPIEPDSAPLRLTLGTDRVDPADLSLYLKSEARERYDSLRRQHPGADEVLLLNQQGELTEGSYHNLVLRLAGRLVTPPLSCGLLPGVMRQELLDQGVISEQLLYPADLERAEEIWLINAVRCWRRADLVSAAPS